MKVKLIEGKDVRRRMKMNKVYMSMNIIFGRLDFNAKSRFFIELNVTKETQDF